jgi:hypothetical protein
LGENQVPVASITASALSCSGPFAVLVADGEGLEGAAVALHLVEAGAADAGHHAAGADVVLERRARGQRLEILRQQFAARRILVGRGEFQPAAVSRRSDALSMAYSHGENSGTWLHWRTAWPTCGPASSTTGSMPRSSTCAAAARPTGPAPRIGDLLRLVQ